MLGNGKMLSKAAKTAIRLVTPLATQPAGSRKAVSGAATRGEHRQPLGASATPSRVQSTKGVSIRSTTSVSTPWLDKPTIATVVGHR